MSSNQTRKPSAAAESFITALAILFFASLAILFMWLDNRKRAERQTQNTTKTEKGAPMSLHENETQSSSPIQSPDSQGWQENMERLVNPHGESAANLTATSFGSGLVSPPLPLLDITPQQTTVNAATGQIITSRHQSVITIPPDAFVDKEGNTVSGNVQVQYREFYNYMDFFLSGIPMNYDSGNTDSQLESAGMFELTAYNGKEPLFVNQNNRINVMMASLKNTPGYNLYFFDKQQKKWIYKGNSNVTVSGQGTAASRLPRNLPDSAMKVFTYTPADYHVKLYSVMEPAQKKKFLQFKKSAPDRFSFHFIGSQRSIPELNALRAYTWYYTGSDALNVYRKLFGYKNYLEMLPRPWNNLTLERVDADNTYLLTMFDIDDTVSIKVMPRLATEGSLKKFAARFAEFTASQEKRRSGEMEAFRKFREDTANYFASNPRWIKGTQSAESFAMRQFQLDGFGIWNCDRPIRMPVSNTVVASFVDQHGNTLKPLRVFLADKSFNTVYSYDEKTLQRFKFNPDAQNLVWALFPGDIVVAIKPKEFREKYAQSASVCRFVVNINSNVVQTQQDLKKQLVFDI